MSEVFKAVETLANEMERVALKPGHGGKYPVVNTQNARLLDWAKRVRALRDQWVSEAEVKV